MIVREHLPLRRIWPHVSKRLMFLFLFDITVAVLYTQLGWKWLSLPTLPLSMIGGAISVFLAFRNNSAYDRWWEARSLWGGLVNSARTFARQVLTLVDEAEDGDEIASRRALVELQIGYVHAFRCHLRKQSPFPELENSLDPALVRYLRAQRNVPAGILFVMGRMLQQLYKKGRLDSYRFTAIDRSLTDLCNIQGACERSKTTRMAKPYESCMRGLVGLCCVWRLVGAVQGLLPRKQLAKTME